MLSHLDPFSTLVPGSRRPFKFLSSQPPPPNQITHANPQDMSVRPQLTSPSTRRRKPTITYRSPSVEVAPCSFADPNLSLPAQDDPMDNTNTSPYSPARPDSSSSTSSPSPRTPSSSSLTSLLTDPSSASSFAKPLSTREVYAMAPPLPLYHPLGALALRLPPLGESSIASHPQFVDPAPSKPVQSPPSTRPRNSTGTNRNRNSGRSRKTTVTKPRDAPADVDLLIADEKDKDQEEYVGTHRRRRNGPSASVSLSASAQAELIAAEGRKRKRREVDTGDPGVSPPIPKRSRQPRAGTSASTPINPVSPTPSLVQLNDEIPDAMEVEEDEEPPPSTRTNGRRRNTKSGRRNSTRRTGSKKEKERTPSSDDASYDRPPPADRPQVDEVPGGPARETEGDGDPPSGDEPTSSSRSPPIVAPVPTHLTKNALEGLNMSAVNVGDRVDSAGPAYI